MKVKITYHKDKLYLKLPGWNKAQREALRQELTIWQNYKGGLLTAYPIKLAYDEVKQYFGDRLVEHSSMQNYHAFIANAVEHGILLDDPYLFPTQIKPATLLNERDRAILTAAPGLGKTVMAIRALAASYPRFVLVVAPVGLLGTWEGEFKKFWLSKPDRPLCAEIEIWETKKQVRPLVDKPDATLIILTTSDVIGGIIGQSDIDSQYGLDYIFGDWSNDTDGYLILDECYRFKNRNSLRSSYLQDLSYLFKNVWLLSGMPIAKYIDDIYKQLEILYPQIFTSYWRFVARYCFIRKTDWGDQIVADKPGALEQLKSDLADILIESEYPANIPGWEPHTITCMLSENQANIYRTLRKEKKVEAETLGADKPLTLRTILSLTGRLVQVASNPALVGGIDISAKEDMLLEVILDNPMPAIVWVEFTDTAQRLQERLERLPGMVERVEILNGDIKPNKRADIVDRFQTGKTSILICNPGVGKYGYTLTAARSMYYLERNYDREKFYQSLYRARRITSKHPVQIYYMLAALPGKAKPISTVDHVIHRLLKDSAENAQRLTVGKLIGQL